MKDWFKHIVLFILLATFTGPLMYAVDYLKLDTTITYYVNKGNNASALYEWTISPSIPSFNDTIVPDTTLTIKWNGDTGIIYTFMVTPISLDSVCDGDPDTMFVKLYTNPINLPIQVSWVNTSDTVCSPVSGSATVAASIDVNYFSGTFTLSYQVDNDSEVTLPPSLVSPVTININERSYSRDNPLCEDNQDRNFNSHKSTNYSKLFQRNIIKYSHEAISCTWRD